MGRAVVVGAVAAAAAIIWLAMYTGDVLDALVAVSAPKLPPPACGEGVTYGGGSIPQSVARRSNEMALELYRFMSDGDGAGKNHAFSPLAVHMAASLLYEGARGDTAEQVRRAFVLDPNREERLASAAEFVLAVRGDDPCTLLDMSTALWIGESSVVPSGNFAGKARDSYGAEVHVADPGNLVDSAGRLDRWAWRETNGRVDGVPDSLPVSGVALTSVARFEGTWVHEFAPYARAQFWKDNGTSVEVDYMKVRGNFTYDLFHGDVHLVKIPYAGGRFTMMTAMPIESGTLQRITDSLTPELLSQWMGPMDNTGCLELAMPRFEIRTGYPLGGALRAMGAYGALVPGKADLSGIGSSPGGLHVSLARHDVFVGVDDEGTSGPFPALTFRGYDPCFTGYSLGSIDVDLAPYTLDRPFLFVIYEEESGAVLFMGRVSDPAAAR